LGPTAPEPACGMWTGSINLFRCDIHANAKMKQLCPLHY
jgi:hypothetical protein